MKLPVLLLTLLPLAFALHAPISAADAGTSNSVAPLLRSSTWFYSGSNIGKFTARDFAATSPFWISSNAPQQVPQSKGTNHINGDLPAPGVYKTEPFACIVAVPGPTPDDRMVMLPANPDQKMPILRPSLRFVPRDSK